jgi:hypothetical protein
VRSCGTKVAASIVPEVAQEPPEARGAAGHRLVVGDDERVVVDAGATHARRELRGAREWMAAAGLRGDREIRQVGVEVEVRGAGQVALEVAGVSRRRVREVVPAVGEADIHRSCGELIAQDARAPLPGESSRALAP